MSDAAVKNSINMLLDVCLGIQPGEDVVVVADTNTEAIAQEIAAAARERSAGTTLIIMTPRGRHGEEPSQAATRAMLHAQAAILPTTYSLSHTRASREARGNGCRVLSLPACSEHIFRNGSLNVDFVKMSSFVKAAGQKLSMAKQARLISGDGSVLTIPLAGRKSVDQTGVCREPGAFGVPPDIETAVSPREGTTSGVLSVDGVVVPGGAVSEPIVVHFKDGVISAIEGGEDAACLKSLLEGYDDPNMFCPVELGLGMNPKAKMGRGIILEDEGEFGAVHIGLGEGRTFSSSISAKAHIDLVLKAPTLELDGKIILQNKELRLDGQTLKLKEGNLECV